MNRMQKVIARAKKEVSANEKIGAFHSRQRIESNIVKYDYADTKVVPINKETLIKNRVIANDKTDARAVRFQMLRAKILKIMRKKGWNTLGISAPTAGSGKSLTSANLACSIAMEGNQSVLLVDMDLRKPSVHKYFDLDPEHGIQDVLDQGMPIHKTLINPGLDRLVILPGVKGVLNSSEQISTPFVKGLILEFKRRYANRIVIFDLPPALAGDDVMVFMPYIDCSILVVENGANVREDIEEALNVLKEKPVLGTVLNKAVTTKDVIY